MACEYVAVLCEIEPVVLDAACAGYRLEGRYLRHDSEGDCIDTILSYTVVSIVIEWDGKSRQGCEWRFNKPAYSILAPMVADDVDGRKM